MQDEYDETHILQIMLLNDRVASPENVIEEMSVKIQDVERATALPGQV